MEPSAALAQIENALRIVVREVMPEWMDTLTPRAASGIVAARDREAAARDGVAASGDLLDFTYTGQLVGLVLDNWDRFAPVLGDEVRTRGFFAFIEDVRNTTAHSRDLLPFERDLLAGIAGQLRNQVGIWRTRAESPNRHYPLIERVTDSLGRAGMDVDEQYQGGGRPVPRLDMGDAITFHGLAHAARGFDVDWCVYIGSLFPNYLDPISMPPVLATGTDVTFDFVLDDDVVGDYQTIGVYIRSRSRFHRTGGYDDARFFTLAVSPPEDA